jgi:hypothetical protein
MKTLSVLLVTALAATLSCAGAKNGPRSSDDAEETTSDEMQPASGTLPAANACPGDDGKPRECSFNTECCPGSSCAFDPDLSRIQKYCL